MNEVLSTEQVQVWVDPQQGTLCLKAQAYKALELCAADTFDETQLLMQVQLGAAQQQGNLIRSGFTAQAKTQNGGCTAEYTVFAQPGVSAVMISTRFRTEDGGKPELPVDWMRFGVNGITALHTLHPDWHSGAEAVTIPTSFRRELILDSDAGRLGIFHAGEPIYDPKEGTVRPDMWLETAGVTGFEPEHTVVIVWAGMKESPAAMQQTADTLYEQAKPLLKHEPEAFGGEEVRFESGKLAFSIAVNPQGAALARTQTIGQELCCCMPLVQLRLLDLKTEHEFTVDSRTGWNRAKLISGNRGARLELSGRKDWPELAVEIELILKPECSRVEWQTHVLNGEQELSVLSASYPPVPWAAQQAHCFIPAHCGVEERDVMELNFCREGIYPRGWRFTMGYFAAYTEQGKGLYCALEDEQGSYRTMTAQADPIRSEGLFFFRLPAPAMGKGGNSFSLPGRIVCQLYDGDWYDAALLYRDFVRSRASWLPAVGPQGREDTPMWAKELPVWIMDWMPNTNPLAEDIPTSLRKKGTQIPPEDWYEQPIRLQKELGVPVGYHVYNWHWIPFNNDYPHYLPEKKEFSQQIRSLQEHQVRIMPYINARLWDTHDHEAEDWQFSSRAKAWATKDRNGKLYTEKYESHEPDGSLCELAAMCPSSAVWKNQMAYVLHGLFEKIGVNGVYMDQIAAAAPYLCEDPAHTHQPGGGSWWPQQYNLLMRRSRQIRGEEGFLTTEDNAEVYLKAMDGVLSWRWTLDHNVPAFPVLYSGYVVMFGRSTNGLKKGDRVFFNYETAEQLVFGGELGWMNADVVDRPEELAFLKKMAGLRWRYAPFFYKGECLRPARIKTDAPSRVTGPMYFDTQLFEAKQLVTGTWRLWDGSRTILLIVSCSDAPVHFEAEFAAEKAELLEGEGCIDSLEPTKNVLLAKGCLEPEGYLVLELTGAR